MQAGTAPTVGRRDLAHRAGHTAWVTLRKHLPSARVGRRGNARYRRGRAASVPRWPSGHRLISERSPAQVRYECLSRGITEPGKISAEILTQME